MARQSDYHPSNPDFRANGDRDPVLGLLTDLARTLTDDPTVQFMAASRTFHEWDEHPQWNAADLAERLTHRVRALTKGML